MVIIWFEDFKKIEQLIYKGIAAKRDAKKAANPSGPNLDAHPSPPESSN